MVVDLRQGGFVEIDGTKMNVDGKFTRRVADAIILCEANMTKRLEEAIKKLTPEQEEMLAVYAESISDDSAQCHVG